VGGGDGAWLLLTQRDAAAGAANPTTQVFVGLWDALMWAKLNLFTPKLTLLLALT